MKLNTAKCALLRSHKSVNGIPSSYMLGEAAVVPCVMARKAGTGFGDIVGSGVNKRLGSTG